MRLVNINMGRMYLAGASMKLFVAKLVTSLASFVAVVVFSRGLGADPLGVYYPFIALLGLLALPTDFGLSVAVEKRISEGADRPQYVGGGALARVVLLIFFSVPVYLYRVPIAGYLGADVAAILLVALWLRAGTDFSMAVLRGELRVGETALIRVLQPLIWLTVGYALLSVGYGVKGIIYSHVLGTVAMFVVATRRISISPAVPQWSHLESLFEFGTYSFVNSIGGRIYSWLDVLILTAFVSLEIASTRGEIGAYENAWRVSLLVTFVSRSIAQVVFPQMSEWDARDETEKIERVLPKAVLPGLVIVPPAFVGVALFSEEILASLFGAEFAVAAPALIVLVGLRFVRVFDGLYGRVLDAMDRPDLTMLSTVVSVVVNVVLNVVLIYLLGILGAAIATTVAFVGRTAIEVYYVREFITVQIPWGILGWSAVSSVVMGAVLYPLSHAVGVQSLVGLLAFVGAGAGIYGVVLFVYTPIRTLAREIADPLVARVAARY